MDYLNEKINKQSNSLSIELLNIIKQKQSNLCVSVDFVNKKNLLSLIESVGPYVCLIKTHCDIIEGFDQDFINDLINLSIKYNFLIFEDRKFADIGNTVSLQYSSGCHKIASWSHMTNAHALPGDGIIEGLKKVGLPLNRGLLLLAQMSSKGSLATGEYTNASVEMAKRHKDFVIGFIAQEKFDDDSFLILTPGVSLDVKGDGIGQQYRTPDQVIGLGTDVIIVGRGVTGSESTFNFDDVRNQALRYKNESWKSFLNVHS